MDGRGRCLDNVYIERFWRTLKQEYIYINPAEDGRMLRQGLKEFIEYYNNQRTHQSLNRRHPLTGMNSCMIVPDLNDLRIIKEIDLNLKNNPGG